MCIRDRVKSAYGQKIKVFDTEIPHSIRAVEATAEGKSIFAYDKSGKVAAAYEQLGKEVAEIGEKQRNQNRADRIPVSYTHLMPQYLPSGYPFWMDCCMRRTSPPCRSSSVIV